MTSVELQEKSRSLTHELNNVVVDATHNLAVDQLRTQFDDKFKTDQKIMNKEEYIRIADIVQQKLDQQLIFFFAIFWLVIASTIFIVLFYLKIFDGKNVFYSLIVIWVGGMSYLGVLFYKKYQAEEIQSVVETANQGIKTMIRAVYPSIQKKCPERCQIKKYVENTSESTTKNMSYLFPSRYPTDIDYWKEGIPKPDKTSKTLPEPVVMPNPSASSYKCEYNNNQIISAQPCDIYPGSKHVLSDRANKNHDIIQRGFYAKMGQ